MGGDWGGAWGDDMMMGGVMMLGPDGMPMDEYVIFTQQGKELNPFFGLAGGGGGQPSRYMGVDVEKHILPIGFLGFVILLILYISYKQFLL